jgi:hypothetical protein
MVSSGMLRRVALVRTGVSEEPGASFIRVIIIGDLGTTQAATSNRRTLRRNEVKQGGCINITPSIFLLHFNYFFETAKWVDHVAGMWGRGTLIGNWLKSQRERDH